MASKVCPAFSTVMCYSTAHLDMLRRAGAESPGRGSIESSLNEATVYHNDAEEVADFVRIVRSFLALDPAKRPRATEALCDPVFKCIE